MLLFVEHEISFSLQVKSDVHLGEMPDGEHEGYT
jgi:hypothetical protein